MDILNRTFQQFAELFRSMTVPQRITLILVPLLVLAGFVGLAWNSRTSGETAISWGKVFSTEELIAAEQALIEAGLTKFRREGQRLMVPETEKDRYNAALLEFDAMPSDLGSQMLKQYESLSPFSTDKQRLEMKEAMLLQELRRTLRAIPDLSDARVVVANSGRRSSWSQKQRVTANVTVVPKSGRELSNRLVRSLQAAVASMVPDLKPQDVTIFDVSNGVTFTGEDPSDPFDSRLIGRIKELTRQYEQQIAKGLDFIPGVGVTVNVDVENIKSSVVRSQLVDPKKSARIFSSEQSLTDNQQQRPTKGEPGQVANRPGSVAATPGIDKTRQLNETENRTLNGVSFEVTEKQLLAAMPKAVQVSVSVPRDYYRDIATQRSAGGEKDTGRLDVQQIEKDVLLTVKNSVQRLIPMGSQPDSVSIHSVDRLVRDIPEPTIPITDRLIVILQDWGGSIVLTGLAIWALLLIRRSIPATAAQSLEEFDTKRLNVAKFQAEEAAAEQKEPTKRDLLQNVVRDNPEMAATVIEKWIQAAK